jgi:hypothetical protein
MKRLSVVLVLAGLFVLLGAAPASAHGVGGAQPTNYKTTIRGIEPSVSGVHVSVVLESTKLQLVNTSSQPVTVLGYSDEPYLRVTSSGVFENQKSPAVFLNQSFIPTGTAPKQYSATATPKWVRISNGNTARWHDHRSHWMGGTPEVVRRDPTHSHVVLTNWSVPLLVGKAPAAIHGDATWIPGPSPSPYYLLALALAALVLLAARRALRITWAAALAVVIGTGIVTIVGSWQPSALNLAGRAGAQAYIVGGVIVASVSLTWLCRKGTWAATPAVLVAGLFVFIAGGLANISSLSRSQLPTQLTPWIARVNVTVMLALGFALLVSAAWRLRLSTPTSGEVREPVGVRS